ncbi:Acetyltransferase (GNAT) family protein [Halogranum amylolyticum]|uniref:Acetyltransferase (GNAT) family protein n=1 Tax=Halogranum amylolyticum TaxID=660520 RepID=A0A1H8UBF1_9EURY|nr:GNAT family N-acetyltransferase [Halogranum amylolyticum]SEP00357.1 Acetyltransferase (GNAT) family protein [Halogranum amylolyticum]
MEFTVRQARPSDGDELLKLWHGFTSHLSEYDERYRHKESANDRWLSYFENQLVDSKYGTVFVAEHEDELVGIAEARVMGNHPIFRLENHGYINGHFVAESHRGHGIGEALLNAAAEWFTSPPRDVDFYRIDTIEGDDTAEDVYEALGLRPVEHVYEKRLE